MHKHLDEQQFERDLRKAFDAVQPDENLHTKGSFILHRNRELSVQFAMMGCRELNRGTELDEIAEVGALAFCEFFANVLDNTEREARKDLASIIAGQVLEAITDLVNGGASFDRSSAAAIPQEVASGTA